MDYDFYRVLDLNLLNEWKNDDSKVQTCLNSFSPNSKYLVGVEFESKKQYQVQVYETPSFSSRKIIESKQSGDGGTPICHTSFSPDNKWLLTCSEKLRAYQLPSFKLKYETSRKHVTSPIIPSPNSKYASINGSKTFSIYSLPELRLVKNFDLEKENPEYQSIIYCGFSGPTFYTLLSAPLFKSSERVEWDPFNPRNEENVFQKKKRIIFFKPPEFEMSEEFDFLPGQHSFVVSPDNKWIVLTFKNDFPQVRSFPHFKMVKKLRLEGKPHSYFSFSKNSSHLVACKDDRISLYEVPSFQKTRDVEAVGELVGGSFCEEDRDLMGVFYYQKHLPNSDMEQKVGVYSSSCIEKDGSKPETFSNTFRNHFSVGKIDPDFPEERIVQDPNPRRDSNVIKWGEDKFLHERRVHNLVSGLLSANHEYLLFEIDFKRTRLYEIVQNL